MEYAFPGQLPPTYQPPDSPTYQFPPLKNTDELELETIIAN